MSSRDADARQTDANLALNVSAYGCYMWEPEYDAHEHFGDRPLLPMRWRLVKPIDGLPLAVGGRLHLGGHRHGSNNAHGDWLTVMVTLLDGECAWERYIVISSATRGSSAGSAVAGLFPPHLVEETA